MYNAVQLTYIITALVATVAILIGARFWVRSDKAKNRFLIFWAVLTFVIHISIMWYQHLTTGQAIAYDNILFPIYFCNASMYLLIIVSLFKNKQSKLFHYLATFVAYAGTFGALITLFECHYFAGPTPDLSFSNFKSMLSHSTMLVGCLYLFVGGFVKIRVSNLVPFGIGLVGCLLLGILVNTLFVSFGLPNPNSMYLVESAISDISLFTGYFIGGVMVVLIFIFTVIWEQFALPKGERWYNHITK